MPKTNWFLGAKTARKLKKLRKNCEKTLAEEQNSGTGVSQFRRFSAFKLRIRVLTAHSALWQNLRPEELEFAFLRR